MKKNFRLPALLLFFLLLSGTSSTAFGAATIVIQNNDAAGVGFNDPTPAAPVGGNAGTTLGEQRLIAFQAAADTWGATLTSSVTITIRAQWTALSCTATSAVLGSAGTISVFRDFTGVPFSGTWYGGALANKLNGMDLDGSTAEINANFNINLGSPGCLTGSFFYLGLDNNHGTDVDLVTVLEHEFAHGFGFQTSTSGSTGVQLGGFPSIYDRFLMDTTTGKGWVSMTDGDRVASAINNKKLVWLGPMVATDVPSVLMLGSPRLKITSPLLIAGNYDVGLATFGAALSSPGVTGTLIQALDPADGAGPLTTDGCSALTNAAAVAGKIALIDRGTCTFVTKGANAQAAGATAVIIVDNVAGSPPPGLGGTDPTITIPAVRVTMADGATIKAQLGSGVTGNVGLDPAVRVGADEFGRGVMFAPDPLQGGSSVSHWDPIAFPNQLMEPAINGDLTHSVVPPEDLTFSLLSDIGWVASSLPSSIASTAGNNQGALLNQQFATQLQATVTPALAGITVTFTANASSGGAFGTFNTTGTKTATALTDGSGVATAPAFTANGQAGIYGVNATAPGSGTTSFTLRNMLTPTAAPGSIGGTITMSDGVPLSGVTIHLSGAASLVTVTDANGNYRFDNVPVDSFYIVTPSLANFSFSPFERSFSLLGSKTDAVFTGSPDAVFTANAIDSTEYFVRQHYLDFLGREPDQGGFDYWDNELLACGGDLNCLQARRIDVSAAFFASAEFQQTGSFIYRLYKIAMCTKLTYIEFNADRQQVVAGANLEESKAAFSDAFVQRAEFLQKYQNNGTAALFVDALLQSVNITANLDLSGERAFLISKYNAGNSTTESRSLVVRAVADHAALVDALYNPSFVLMEYFGYLRRDPDLGGYDFWLEVLNNREPNNYRGMVCAFITSAEYQRRFSPVVTRTNSDCGE